LYTLSEGTGYGEESMLDRPRVQCALEGLSGALVDDAVSGHAELALQPLDGLRALRSSARVLPTVRGDTVTQLGGLVRLVLDQAINEVMPDAALQCGPRVGTHPPI